MPDFRYQARELSGKQVSGVLTATSEKDALSILAARSLFPMSVALTEQSKQQASAGSRRVPTRYLTVFYNQLSDLLKSGVPLLRSLQLLEDQTSNPVLRAVVQDIREQVADGTRLNDAMRRHPRTFNFLSISMVKAGEEGGFLEEVLSRIAVFNEHQEELRGRVTGAMVYPMFLMTVGLAIVTVMMIWFVPEFASMFDRMQDQGTLPWATTTLLSISDLIQQRGLLLLAVLGGVIFGIVYYIQTPEGSRNLDRLKLRLPGLGGILQSLAVARFCRMLGTLLKNGVPILQSLRIAKDASGNVILAEAIGNAADNVSSGQSLAVPLRASGQFSRDLIEMIAVGEEANNLENVLINVADNMEKRTSRRIDMVVRLLEPMLLLVMATVVTFVIAALLLPVLNMSSNR
ncbi:MAG: type II secretion system F family protein [Planctomyces sp.]|jgi:general secretion pathway protein F|nr:type II secretion system F family protein [Planctomyces sp.]HAV34718.1 pilus assembly protein PilC [Planctomycetaceae bacterium]HBC61934.1 pilus assembly protein PilC [Planctomycetaceae bacterium]